MVNDDTPPFAVGQRVRFADNPDNRRDMRRLIGVEVTVTRVRRSYCSQKWMLYVQLDDGRPTPGAKYSRRFEAIGGPW
jgi:hypothetical protein